MKKIYALCLLVMSVGFSGCYTSEIRQYAKLDPNDKTVFAPVGEGKVISPLKDVLRNQGWKVLVKENDQYNTTGTLGLNTQLNTQSISNARYSLLISSQFVENSVGVTGYDYQISFVDNKTGEEVFTLHGVDTEDGIANHFSSALNAVSLPDAPPLK